MAKNSRNEREGSFKMHWRVPQIAYLRCVREKKEGPRPREWVISLITFAVRDSRFWSQIQGYLEVIGYPSNPLYERVKTKRMLNRTNCYTDLVSIYLISVFYLSLCFIERIHFLLYKSTYCAFYMCNVKNQRTRKSLRNLSRTGDSWVRAIETEFIDSPLL